MICGKTVSLVIPCKNEESSLAKMLRRVPSGVDEVVVVDNNSTDKTAQVAKKFGAVVVKEIRKDGNGIGYGYAHRKGMKVATGDLIVTMDGDGTYPLEQIGEVVEFMQYNGIDFVACSRFPLKNAKAISKMRQLGVWILNTEVQTLYQYPMQDILSGMWVMNRNAVRKLKLKEGGWDLSPEIKLAALMSDQIRLEQYHIDHHHRDNGASKQELWTTGFNHFRYIVKRRLLIDNRWVSWLKPVLTKPLVLNFR